MIFYRNLQQKHMEMMNTVENGSKIQNMNYEDNIVKEGESTWCEINLIKEKMDKAENDLNRYRNEVDGEMTKLRESIKEQRLLCKTDPTCLKKLDDHLKVCVSKTKCTIDFLQYGCRFKYNMNGKCSHDCKIEDLERSLDNHRAGLYEYNSPFIDLQSEYERALAIKEDRLEEYEIEL